MNTILLEYYRNDIIPPYEVISEESYEFSEIYRSGSIRILSVSKQEHTTGVHFFKDDGDLLITSVARLYNKAELIKALSIFPENVNIPETEIIGAAFKKWGKECVNHLVGDFSFCVFDKKNTALFCARDHIGGRPFYYSLDSKRFLFSNDLYTLLKFGKPDDTPCKTWYYDMLIHRTSEKNLTPFEHINLLPPGHSMMISHNKTEIKRYWDLKNIGELKYANEQRYYDEYYAHLFEAVSCRIAESKFTAVELSGGLDSTAVAYIASSIQKEKGNEVLTCSHIINKNNPAQRVMKDERELIHLFLKKCEIRNSAFIDAKVKYLIRYIDQLPENMKLPLQLKFAIFSDGVFEKCTDFSADTLLSGFGGDQLVTSNAGKALYEIFRKKHYRHLWSTLMQYAKNTNKNPVWTLFSFFMKNSFPELYHLYTRDKSYPESRINRFPLTERGRLMVKDFFKDLREDRFIKQGLRERQYEKIMEAHIPHRLENSYLMASGYGMNYSFPLLDVRLMEYYFSLPPEVKFKDGWGRYMIRKVMDKKIPDEIVWRNDKSYPSMPNVAARMYNDQMELNSFFLKYKGGKTIDDIIDLDALIQITQKLKEFKDISLGELQHILDYVFIIYFMDYYHIEL